MIIPIPIEIDYQFLLVASFVSPAILRTGRKEGRKEINNKFVYSKQFKVTLAHTSSETMSSSDRTTSLFLADVANICNDIRQDLKHSVESIENPIKPEYLL